MNMNCPFFETIEKLGYVKVYNFFIKSFNKNKRFFLTKSEQFLMHYIYHLLCESNKDNSCETDTIYFDISLITKRFGLSYKNISKILSNLSRKDYVSEYSFYRKYLVVNLSKIEDMKSYYKIAFEIVNTNTEKTKFNISNSNDNLNNDETYHLAQKV